MSDNLKMNNHYSDNELRLMSYQDLRRLSILLELPANIKKKYMISMIQAHQKGDECMKTAIANKVMEERKVKRLNNKKKHSKPCMVSRDSSQQAPTDLSVSTQHEFETHFSYVAHFTSKDELSTGISRIVKEEAEASRRNRSVLQQSRKSTRKISAVGKTEIMLPRNHSLTTPVRLMPQHERGFPCPGDYEFMSGLSSGKNHFQDLNYNYHFHGEFSNSLVPTTSHELYRNEPYWHTREIFNNSLMPILSSLLTPNSVTINSSSYASQYTPNNSTKGPTSFQDTSFFSICFKPSGINMNYFTIIRPWKPILTTCHEQNGGVYENYIKSNSIIESHAFQSSATNSSTLILSNHHLISDNNNYSGSNHYSFSRGSCLNGKASGDLELTGAANDINCKHCYKREATVTKDSHEDPSFLVDFYTPRNGGESDVNYETTHLANVRDVLQCSDEERCRQPENNDVPSPEPYRLLEPSSAVTYNPAENLKAGARDQETLAPIIKEYESNFVEEGKIWGESQNGLRKEMENGRTEKEPFMEGSAMVQSQGSFESDVSETYVNFSAETDSTEELPKNIDKEILNCGLNSSRCRYILGHDKYPEAVSDSIKAETLPSFPSAFSTSELYNKGYSVCKNSFTGTTESHLNPIMTCTYSSQFSFHATSQEAQINNTGNGSQFQRQWYYSFPEYQVPFSDSTTYTNWSGFSNGMDTKIMAENNNNPNVQIVQCRTHGWHYLYSISNPCD